MITALSNFDEFFYNYPSLHLQAVLPQYPLTDLKKMDLRDMKHKCGALTSGGEENSTFME